MYGIGLCYSTLNMCLFIVHKLTTVLNIQAVFGKMCFTCRVKFDLSFSGGYTNTPIQIKRYLI